MNYDLSTNLIKVKQNKYIKQKIDTYITVQDALRLKSICDKYGFKSTYQLLQYLVHCFLRVADPANDPIDEPIPQEIEDMFTNNADWETHKYSVNRHNGMNIIQKPDQRKYKTPDDLK